MSARRRFLAAMLAALPSVALAQKKPARIGLLWLASEEDAHLRRALLDGLRQHGYAEGRNIVLDDARAASYEKLVDAAKGLVEREASVILTWGYMSVRAARAASSRIPIVMNAGIDPVKTGLAASLSRPGGNVTGVTTLNVELQSKQLQLVRETLPRAQRVSAILDPTSGTQTGYFDLIEAQVRKLSLAFDRTDVRSAADLEPAIRRAAAVQSDALYVIPSTLLQRYARRIGELALKYRLPSFAYSSEYAEGGVMLVYGVNRAAVFRRVAAYVDRILKGSPPGEIPIEQASEFELIVNSRTAKALGVTIPPAVLVRATRTLE